MTGKDALRAPFQDKAAADPVAARRGMPTWLMSVVFTAGFGVLLVGLYFGIQYYKGKNEATTQAAPPKLETPSAEAPKPGALPKSNPLEKHLEVTGLRLLQDQAKKTEVRFVLVNHSGAEIADLAGEVNLMARTAKNDVASVGAFPFKTSLGPYESKELNATLNTQLKVYEIPDWQNLRSEIKITSPQ